MIRRRTPQAIYPDAVRVTPIASLFDLAPNGVYLATNCYQLCGALLPHPFTLTLYPKVKGGLLSAALAVSLRCPDVIWRPTLWSPDFPRFRSSLKRDCSVNSPTQCNKVIPKVTIKVAYRIAYLRFLQICLTRGHLIKTSSTINQLQTAFRIIINSLLCLMILPGLKITLLDYCQCHSRNKPGLMTRF